MKRLRLYYIGAVLLAVAAGDCLAEINLVQDTSETAQISNSVSATFSQTPTEGNLLIAIAGNRIGSTAPSTPSGWSLLIDEASGTPGQIIYYKIAGASESATLTVGPYPISTSRGLHLYEYSGIDTLSPIGDSVSTSGSGLNVTSGDVTTDDEALILAGVTINAITSFSSWSNSFEEINDFINAGTPVNKTVYASAHLMSYDAGTFSTTGTSDSTGPWLCHLLTINAEADCECTVTTVADAGPGSLRECLEYANNCSRTTISFNIAEPCNQSKGGDSWWRISPTSQLPYINSHLTAIDGTTQAINQGDSNSLGPEIEINGALAGSVDGFTVYKPDNLIRGLVINGFSGSTRGGIFFTSWECTGNSVHGCYLGTSATGDSAIANYNGVRFMTWARNNQIGGPGADEWNLISGNTNYGIYQTTNCNNNEFLGNHIGTNAAGTAALGNGIYGIYSSASRGVIIGGTGAGKGNLVSGNGSHGIYLSGSDSARVQGNNIGTDLSGTAKISNGGAGISVSTSDTVMIGGASNGAGNVTSGNGRQGIVVAGGNLCYIYGNHIGTGQTGTETGLGNDSSSVKLYNSESTDTMKVGGLNEGEGNIIAGGAYAGVYVDRNGAEIEVAGNTVINHDGSGVLSDSQGLRIVGNLIWGNGSRGISVYGTNNKIYHNTIHGNGHINTRSGIWVNATGTIIKNNIITGSADYGIHDSLAYATEEYNLITDEFTNAPNDSGRANISLDASDINADPLYADTLAGDFTLTEPTSPAIDAGLPLGADQPDMNGAEPGNFNGTAPDMGAFESSAPGVLSVFVTNSTFGFGVVQINQWLPADSSLVINNGAVAENFLGRIGTLTDGSNTWDISDVTNGADSIRAQWSTASGTGPWTDIAAYASDFSFATNVAVSDTVIIWFRIQTPVSTSSYGQHQSLFTVTAEAF
ncbi:MAG: right-handed parallel beta-helix repeat-containing protein [Candidatus Zixiibacteriota bacterium]|nr:MAG: right-handed parallel beta-helix repeat-containing protein [candidate division Zixibacteria bacterium]